MVPAPAPGLLSATLEAKANARETNLRYEAIRKERMRPTEQHWYRLHARAVPFGSADSPSDGALHRRSPCGPRPRTGRRRLSASGHMRECLMVCHSPLTLAATEAIQPACMAFSTVHKRAVCSKADLPAMAPLVCSKDERCNDSTAFLGFIGPAACGSF